MSHLLCIGAWTVVRSYLHNWLFSCIIFQACHLYNPCHDNPPSSRPPILHFPILPAGVIFLKLYCLVRAATWQYLLGLARLARGAVALESGKVEALAAYHVAIKQERRDQRPPIAIISNRRATSHRPRPFRRGLAGGSIAEWNRVAVKLVVKMCLQIGSAAWSMSPV